jgi:hypothetical protein
MLVTIVILVRALILKTIFGTDSAKYSLFIEVVADPRPPGWLTFVQIEPDGLGEPNTK